MKNQTENKRNQGNLAGKLLRDSRSVLFFQDQSLYFTWQLLSQLHLTWAAALTPTQTHRSQVEIRLRWHSSLLSLSERQNKMLDWCFLRNENQESVSRETVFPDFWKICHWCLNTSRSTPCSQLITEPENKWFIYDLFLFKVNYWLLEAVILTDQPVLVQRKTIRPLCMDR